MLIAAGIIGFALVSFGVAVIFGHAASSMGADPLNQIKAERL